MSGASVPGSVPSTPSGPSPPRPDDSVRVLLSVSKTLALVFAILAGLLFIIFLAFAFLDLFLGRGAGNVVAAVYCLASAAVNYVLWREIPKLERRVSAGEYRLVREELILWAILGVVFFVAVGVLLLVAWIRVETLANPQTS